MSTRIRLSDLLPRHITVSQVKSSGERVLTPEIKKNVKRGTQVYSDQAQAYTNLDLHGYPHASINHSLNHYVDGNVHTQNVENLWSNMKRGIRGVYRHVDAKYLQAYVDEYAFRYSHRKDFQPMFWALLMKVTKA
jgi:transposase-like protein